MVRRVLQDNKVPGASMGTRAAAAPDPEPARSATGFLCESQFNGSLSCQKRFEQHQEGPGCLKLQRENKDKVVNTQGQCTPTKTVDDGSEELGSDRP